MYFYVQQCDSLTISNDTSGTRADTLDGRSMQKHLTLSSGTENTIVVCVT